VFVTEERSSTKMQELRVGIIGAGNWARAAHLPAFANQEAVHVVGITDLDLGRAEALAEEFGIAKAYPDLEGMLDEAGLDILDIVTSRGMHFEPAMAGLGRDLDLLCEKPLGHNLREARSLYGRARERGVVAHMGFTFRYSPAVRYLRDLILDGFAGEVYHLQGFEQNALLVDPETPLPRIGFSRETDSGALHGYGSHLLDLARWILGEFEQVIGDMATYIQERPVMGEEARLRVEVDDSTTVLARFERGVQGLMQFSKIAMGRPPGVEMRIYGSKAGLWVRLEDSPQGYERLWQATLEDRNFRPLEVPAEYSAGHDLRAGSNRNYYTALVGHFLQRVRERDMTAGSSDFSDGLRAQEVLEAIEMSHIERRWVRLAEVLGQE
jgi:predicted dehydrogenase